MRDLDTLISENAQLLNLAQERLDGLGQVRAQLEEMAQELARAREAGRAASTAKAEFLANVSHEIRTPMNGIMATAELLRATPLDDEQRDYVETIARSGAALLALIDDILAMSAMQAGRTNLENVELDLQSVFEQTMEAVWPSAGEKPIDFAAVCSVEVPRRLRGDPVRLRHVLVNLVGNALKFTNEGHVLLRADLMEDGEETADVRFSVIDTGRGMSRAEAERMFAPFSQADGSATRRFAGAGLGLGLSQRLVRAMGGEITVRSSPGQGSTFSFTLRMQKQSVQPEPRAHVLRGGRAIVAAEGEAMRVALPEFLAACGMHVGEAPLEHLPARLDAAIHEGQPFDLAVIECNVADDWCLSKLVSLLDDPSLSRLPVVLVLPKDEIVARNASLPAVTCKLHKPVRLSDLENLLANVATIPRAAEIVPFRPQEVAGSGSAGILVVEDNAVNQKIGLKMLAKLGCHADLARDGREALVMLSRKRYDLVLMDCQMPELDGLEATRELRARERASGGHTIVVAMTANALEGSREACLASGMDDYLTKPLKASELAGIIQRWIRSGSDDCEIIPQAAS